MTTQKQATTNTPWTPGPLEASGQHIWGTGTDGHRRCVAICSGNFIADPLANAQLFALAPEMADALQELLRSYDATHGKLISGTTSFADAYFKARDILARLPQKGGEK